ncbi:MAG: Na/Pi cotransporter family protein [Cytophagaceae bacterium]|jgi:phosphate:Na+ symporter|nr:Na/Pi cotransporter family protein [Cytophagaceae bacterium]
MDYSFLDFLTLAGSLGLFLFGMKIMSESLQKVAGSKMRSILSIMTSNRFFGVLTGFLVTAIIQSSSATTVMVVGFVNAGLINLTQSIGVIMGANIGTTVTAWLISIFGFKVQISDFALPLIAFSLLLIFSKRANRRSWGECIVGFSLLFMGLDFLKNSMPDISKSPEMLGFLQNYTNIGFASTLIFLFIGTILTVVIQSSSATMALTIIMCNQGWISFDLAAAMVLGENVGTTITANLAAAVGNVSAKRTARVHFIFNLLGVVWMLLIFKWFTAAVAGFVSDKAVLTATETPIALSMFHTSFNIINVLIFVWFTPLLRKIVIWMVPSKEDEEEFRLKYITTGMLSTSELSILQVKKEARFFAKHTKKMFGFFKKLIMETNENKFTELYAQIQKYESISDKVEVEIANYVSKISQYKLSEQGRLRIGGVLKLSGDLESIADCVYNLARTANRMREKKITFNDEAMEKLQLMFTMVDTSLDVMRENLAQEEEVTIHLEKAYEVEDQINNYRDHLKAEHLDNLSNNVYSYEAGIIFNDIFSECEKIGDYVINVSEALNENEKR